MYKITPTDQISTSFPYAVPHRISGATYPGVPHATVMSWLGLSSVARPKSASFRRESSSLVAYKMFSGFRSLLVVSKTRMDQGRCGGKVVCRTKNS